MASAPNMAVRDAAISRLMGNSAVPGQVRTPRHTPDGSKAAVRLGMPRKGPPPTSVPQLEHGRV